MNQQRPLIGAMLLAGALALAHLAGAQEKPPSSAAVPDKGPAIGRRIPPFQARDQFGREQTPTTLTGRKGFVLLFFRSADW
jgi:hypothetical protein